MVSCAGTTFLGSCPVVIERGEVSFCRNSYYLSRSSELTLDACQGRLIDVVAEEVFKGAIIYFFFNHCTNLCCRIFSAIIFALN